MQKVAEYCQDFGLAPDCLGVPDPAYTMRFDAIGKEPLHWCSNCGPLAQAVLVQLHRNYERFGEAYHRALNMVMEDDLAKRVKH